MVAVLRGTGRSMSVPEIALACCAKLGIEPGVGGELEEHKDRTRGVLDKDVYGLFKKEHAGYHVHYSLRIFD